MSVLGALTACAIAFALPGIYYVISINKTKQTHTIEAAFIAKSVETIIQARPDLWLYESIRLTELVSQPLLSLHDDEREIRDTAGKLVAKNNITVPRPIILISAPLFDSGRPSGSIVVRTSIRTIVINTAISGILSALLGGLIYFIFRIYPLRKLDNTLEDLYQERVKSLKTLYAIGDGVISVDYQGKIQFINRIAEELVGMDSAQVVGRQLEEVYAVRQSQDNPVGDFGEKEVILTGKGGGEFPIEEIRTKLSEIEGDESGVVIVFRDITERKQAEAEREKYTHELQDALANIRTLNEMLPICASCKKIRDDNGYWSQVETYISSHSDTVFTSGICPDCEKAMYAKLEQLKNENC